MWINTELKTITQDDTIILANNRQSIAFKRTWGLQKGKYPLPKTLPWHQYLETTWRLLEPNTEKRLISNIESRMLIKQSMQILGQNVDANLLDEVIKNNDYCHTHLINYTQLSNSDFQVSRLFATWLKHYQKIKLTRNLLDYNDLPMRIIKTHNCNLTKPYVYGFKTLTPIQLLLFDKIGFRTFELAENNTQNDSKIFQNTQDEMLTVARWAKNLNLKHPDKNIAIVCPTLSKDYHQIQSVFNQVFTNTLVETGQKSYNISLGLPLTEYPLIRHILTLLEFCQQLQNNCIKTHTFNNAIVSPYIAYAQQEKSARALLVNHVLNFSTTQFKFARLENYLKNTPKLKTLLEKITAQTPKKQQTHDQWLLDFDAYLQIWGFATDRVLSSTEYQLLDKYQQSTLGLNQLAQTKIKIDAICAISDLQDWLSQVIFQAKSAKTPIQILGALEAQGLYFDKAWVLGMSDEYLPETLNTPRFIPNSIAIQHKIPRTSFDLIKDDAQKTFACLNKLSDMVIFSYAKTHFDKEQCPCPLLKFEHETLNLEHLYQTQKLEILDNTKAKPLENKQVHSGVNILKSQMACAFSGFAHRFNIQPINTPHIGLDRIEQGEIIHKTLQYFYEEINSHEALLSLTQDKLTALINVKINTATQHYQHTGFTRNEKKRIVAIIYKLIEIDKQRESFVVLSTEKSVDVDVAGLKFTTRLDRLDKTKAGDKIIYDYKIGNPTVNQWCGESITQPQLPIYAIANTVEGIAFIQLNADKVSIKGLAKNTDLLPKQSSRHSCQTWEEQIITWKTMLNAASHDFQQGKAQVLPNKIACQYCEFDSLCRIEK